MVSWSILCQFQHGFFAVGMLGDKRAKLYDMVFERAILGGNVVEREESNNAIPDYNEKMKGLFHFVQTEDGSIPVTIFSREEDREIVNIKKAVVSAFQANFEGSKFKEEADPQSLHKSEYRYIFTMYNKKGVELVVQSL